MLLKVCSPSISRNGSSVNAFLSLSSLLHIIVPSMAPAQKPLKFSHNAQQFRSLRKFITEGGIKMELT